MRHHGRTENAEREIEHLRIGDDLGRGRKAHDHRTPVRIGHRDLDGETNCDDAQEGHDEGFDPAEAEVLHPQDQEHIESRDQHPDLERNPEQQVEPDRRSDHLGEVGRADCDLRHHPERHGHRARKGVAARLRKIAPGADPEPRTQRLQQDRHHVGQQCDRQERIAKLGTAGERGRPIARVHVADGHQIARSQKGQELLAHRPGRAGCDRAKDLGQRRGPAWLPPTGLRRGWNRHRGG